MKRRREPARQTLLAYLRHRVVDLKRTIRETRENDSFMWKRDV